jgi:hypothetical protein
VLVHPADQGMRVVTGSPLNDAIDQLNLLWSPSQISRSKQSIIERFKREVVRNPSVWVAAASAR